MQQSPLNNSILAPRNGEEHPYLMPCASASHCAASDVFGDGLPMVYPRRIIWVDFDNGDDTNDGSKLAPLKTLSRVFSDELLACVCAHIGEDRLPVCCKGTCELAEEYTIESGENAYNLTLLSNAGKFDYCRHLEIMPWPHCAPPVFKIALTAELKDKPQKKDAQPKVKASCTIAKELTGVYWNKCRFEFEINIGSAFDDYPVELNTDLHGFDNCDKLAAIGCTMGVVVNRYDGTANAKPDTTTGGSTSDSRDEYKVVHTTFPRNSGSATFPARQGSSTFRPPSDSSTDYAETVEKEPTIAGIVTGLGIIHYCACDGAFVAGGGASWAVLVTSKNEIGVTSTAFDQCDNLHARDYVFNATSLAQVKGSGENWQKEDGAHGVKQYELNASAVSRIVADCDNAILHNVTGSLVSKAHAVGTNTPYTTDKDGNTAIMPILGQSIAAAIAFTPNTQKDDASAASVFADAQHPNGTINAINKQIG
jgi:hypothetical protein